MLNWSPSGRASKAEYWRAVGWWSLMVMGLVVLSMGPPLLDLIVLLLYAGSVWPMLVALPIRRLHDINKPAWLAFIPIIGFIHLFTQGDEGPNRYGPPSDFGS